MKKLITLFASLIIALSAMAQGPCINQEFNFCETVYLTNGTSIKLFDSSGNDSLSANMTTDSFAITSINPISIGGGVKVKSALNMDGRLTVAGVADFDGNVLVSGNDFRVIDAGGTDSLVIAETGDSCTITSINPISIGGGVKVKSGIDIDGAATVGGYLVLPGLPTDSTGLPDNTIWVDGDVLKIKI